MKHAGRSARIGLLIFGAGVAAIAIAYTATVVLGSDSDWAAWLLAFACAAMPVGLFSLGAVTRGVLSRGVLVLLGMLFVVLFASFGAALALAPDEGPGGRLLLGLPLRLAIVFYGVGFVPLLALPIAFARTFPNGAATGSHPGEPVPAGAPPTGSSRPGAAP